MHLSGGSVLRGSTGLDFGRTTIVFISEGTLFLEFSFVQEGRGMILDFLLRLSSEREVFSTALSLISHNFVSRLVLLLLCHTCTSLSNA